MVCLQWPLLAQSHVFVTPTQKNKLYTTGVWNHHVPRLELGWGWKGVGGSWVASGKKSWCTQMTSGRANDPWIHQEISVPPRLRSRDKAPSCTDGGLTHTHDTGGISTTQGHMCDGRPFQQWTWKWTLVLGEWVLVITISFPYCAIVKLKIVSFYALYIFIFRNPHEVMVFIQRQGRPILLQLATLCSHCS